MFPCQYLSLPSRGPKRRIGTYYDADTFRSRMICYTATPIRRNGPRAKCVSAAVAKTWRRRNSCHDDSGGEPCHRACIANLQCDPGKGRRRPRGQNVGNLLLSPLTDTMGPTGSHILDMHVVWVDSLDPGSPTCKSHPSSGESTGDTSRMRHGPPPFGAPSGAL